MAGGLLNIVAYGNQNVILNGNPSKTFFKSTYKKYTNFGMQKFRVDFDGVRKLRMSEPSKFTFRIPRYAELLMDTYLCVQLPTIWSPIFPPQGDNGIWQPYEFKWIENLGSKMINEVVFSVGGQVINRYSGDFILAQVQRDFSKVKTDLFDKMTGNVPELNDPANFGGRVNVYPNAYNSEEDTSAGPEPSIRARKLYIPLNSWFSLASTMAFPLVSLQYNELEIDITLKPVQELFQVRDVEDTENMGPYIQPNFNSGLYSFYRFLQPPPDISLSTSGYEITRTDWNADVHLLCTYCFLSEEESKVFAAKEQKYLFKSIYEWKYFNVVGTRKVKLESSSGMVSSLMWYFQRSDINMRNEWSNYTNWPYNHMLPYDVISAPTTLNSSSSSSSNNGSIISPGGVIPFEYLTSDGTSASLTVGPGVNPSGEPTGLFITGPFAPENQKNILENLGIMLDGKYRENLLDSGVYNYVEKYLTTPGNAPDGLYVYNFCLHTDPYTTQPSGALNLSKFTDIQLEFDTHVPSLLNPDSVFKVICDPETNEVIGTTKPSWCLYEYSYNLTVMEERYNVLHFVAGNCGLLYAR